MGLYRNFVWFCHGYSNYTKGGYERAQKNFNPEALNVDMTGKNVIITGANSGLGKEAARQIALKGATVHLLCRNEERGKESLEDLAKEIPKTLLILHKVDMSSPKDVIAFAESFQSQNKSLDILINNAGCMINERKLTIDDLETNFATNTFGPFTLTEKLMPLLERTKNSRVINVTSGGMLTQKLDYSDIKFEKMKPFDGTMAYAQNKRQQVELGHFWAQNHPCIHFFSAHPGWAETPGVIESMPSFYERFKNSLRTVEQGADTIIWCAISNEAIKLPNGAFVGDRKVEAEHLLWSGTESTNEDRKKFFNILQNLLKTFE